VPNGSGFSLTPSGTNPDGFLLKLSTDGDFQWVRVMGGSSSDRTNDVYIDSVGNVYATGYYWFTADFNPAPVGTGYSVGSNGTSDIFLIKYDSAGTFNYVKTFGGSGVDSGEDIFVTNTDEILIAGKFANTVDFDPSSGTTSLTAGGNYNGFVNSFDTAGNHQWATRFGDFSGNCNTMNGSNCMKMHVNSLGEIAISSQYRNTADFNPTGTGYSLSSISGSDDPYTLILDNLGNFDSVVQIGSELTDAGIATHFDVNDNLYLGGYIMQTSTSGEFGDWHPGTKVVPLKKTGQYEGWLLKLCGY